MKNWLAAINLNVKRAKIYALGLKSEQHRSYASIKTIFIR